jgi:hypothetical protein
MEMTDRPERKDDQAFTFETYFQERKDAPLLHEKELPQFAGAVKRSASNAGEPSSQQQQSQSAWNNVHPAVPIACWSASLVSF